ncbi:cytochrome P450 [Chaetomidium leptoderma]|uniref:Cytochrome P450 n=1 Tax=Chaetomidium leptoderma TaxID=669021 RepID=A0AAN6VM48_9PEZI|nr:cytochrome P450 [Chaetomidium leptoderma]
MAIDSNLLTLLMVPPYVAWPLIAITLSTLLATSYALYNVLLHPLRAIPGPKLWAATPFSYTLAWLSGRLPVVIHELHEKYGDTVRVTPTRVSFTHPDAWRDIRGHRKSGQGENSKDPAFYALSRHNILGASREDHARFRKILSHGFSAKSMQEQQRLITRYVDLLMERLGERTQDEGGEPKEAVVNLAAWFNFTTFDVIGDLAFGAPFGCLQESRYHPWVEAIFLGVEQFGLLVAFHWHFPTLLGLIRRFAPKGYIGVHMDMQTEYANQLIRKRLQLDTSRPDFVEAMSTAKSDDGRMLTREEMGSNGRLLVVAGSETTATALSGTAYFLATHPAVQKKLAEEVRRVFRSEDEIDLFSVNKLKYMLAVLDEAMRMFPPVPSQLPRACQPGGDMICGYQIPEGTGLDIFPWAMNYSSRNFTEPFKFIPERWLDEDEYQGQQLDKRRQSAFQPFSVGSRNCIGKNLAYVEMRLILARLIWNYNLVLEDDASGRFLDCKSFNLWTKGALNVRLVPVSKT